MKLALSMIIPALVLVVASGGISWFTIALLIASGTLFGVALAEEI